MAQIQIFNNKGLPLSEYYQWDIDQVIKVQGLDVENPPVFHFANRKSKRALVVASKIDGDYVTAEVPNILLMEPETINVYLFEDANLNSAHTSGIISIPVYPRPQPNDYIYKDNVEYISTALINSRLAALAAGLSNSGNGASAEVADIRVKKNGTIFDCAGDAVRDLETQMEKFKLEVDENFNQFQEMVNQDIFGLSDEVNAFQNDLEEVRATAESVSDEVKNYIDAKAADGFIYDETTGELYLASKGEPMSDPVIIKGGGGGGGSGTDTNDAKISIQNTCGWNAKTIAKGNSALYSFIWSSVENDLPTGAGTLRILLNNALVSIQSIEQGEVTINLADYGVTGNNTFKLEVLDIYGNKKSQSASLRIMDFYLESSFDSTQVFSNAIKLIYTPFGTAAKVVHFIVDDEEIGTQTVTPSGRQQNYTVPKQSHGSHSLEIYFTATVDGQQIESNHLFFSLTCLGLGNNSPIVSVEFNEKKVKQFTTIPIPYSVYDPRNLQAKVLLKADGIQEAELTIDRTRKVWNYRCQEAGNHTLSITCGTSIKLFSFEVEPVDLDVKAETNDLQLYLSSYGRSNSEAVPGRWFYKDIDTQFTGFNWSTDGWQVDKDGYTVLRVNGEARVNIPYRVFANDFKNTGATIEIEFATHDVRNYDAEIISCMNNDRGFRVTAQEAVFKAEQSEIRMQFKEDEHIRLTFVVEKRVEDCLIYCYVDGVMSRCIQYNQTEDFSQPQPATIRIGSGDCGVDIYNIRIYDNNLSKNQVVDNWIADTVDGELMLDRYSRNAVYDEYGSIVVQNLPKDLPYMILTGAQLPQYKGDKKTIDVTYVDPTNSAKDFTATGVSIDVQGTSSQFYARKNYKLKYKSFITNSGITNTYCPFTTGLETNVFCLKADVASSEGANNVELVRLYNDICPAMTPPQKENELVRQGIDGRPIVVFWNDGDRTMFLGKYNQNFDKSSDVYGFSDGDESWEICNNVSNRVIFKSDDFSTKEWLEDFEGRYPDGNEDPINLKPFVSWIKSTNGNLSKFKAELANWCNVDSALFYYIFTEVFLMVDSRAKNAFPTRFDKDGKWYWLPYDMDTALGINNEGQLVFTYSLEDTDLLEGGAKVFNGQDSVFWCNLRNAFGTEIASMYKTLRSSGNFSYQVVRDRFLEHQSKWPAAIYNEDAQYKYLDPLVNSDTPNGSYLTMLQGDKKSQRDSWLYNRFRYMDSKFNCGDDTVESNIINVRIYAPSTLTFQTYTDMYVNVKAGSKFESVRTKRNTPVHIPMNLDGANDLEVAFYSASSLTSVGDLSGFKIGYANFAAATKLQELKLGDSTPGYTNENLTELYLGNNTLLKKVDCRNCVNLGTGTLASIDVSNCTGIEELYFDNTSIAGVVLPEGGQLRRLHLPETVSNLTILNQKKLVEFSIPSFRNITTLRLENTSSIVDPLEIIKDIQQQARVRILGFDTEAENVDEIFELLDKLDNFRGIDEKGDNLPTAQVQGIIRIPEISQTNINNIKARYPYIEIIADRVVCILRYMNEDGTSVYHTEVVEMEGNGVWEPTADAITKESDEKSDYRFAGWATTIGGRVNVNAKLSIFEDRDIYAVFASTPRVFTVEFYDGSNKLSTQQVAFNTAATPPAIGTDGFDRWIPNPNKIYKDTIIRASYAQQTGVGEISDSWDTIISNIQSGNYKQYKVGQTKPLVINGMIYNMQLVGIDRDLDEFSAGFAKTSWLSLELHPDEIKMAPELIDIFEQVDVGPGWAYSPDDGYWQSMNAGLNSTSANCTWSIVTTSDGTLTLDYKVSSEANFDKLSVYIDGTAIEEGISGSKDWMQYTYNFKAGATIQVKAVFTKDASGFGYEDRSYLRIDAGSSSHITANPETIYINGQFIRSEIGTGSIGGWEESAVRKFCNQTLYNQIPTKVRKAIVPASKFHYIVNEKKEILYRTATDKIWIPTIRDMFPVDDADAYYSALFPNDASRKKIPLGNTWEKAYWQMDAYDISNGSRYYSVGNNGAQTSDNANGIRVGLAFGFCI